MNHLTCYGYGFSTTNPRLVTFSYLGESLRISIDFRTKILCLTSYRTLRSLFEIDLKIFEPKL